MQVMRIVTVYNYLKAVTGTVISQDKMGLTSNKAEETRRKHSCKIITVSENAS